MISNDDTKISRRNTTRNTSSDMAALWERLTRERDDDPDAMAMMISVMDPFQIYG